MTAKERTHKPIIDTPNLFKRAMERLFEKKVGRKPTKEELDNMMSTISKE